jgi:hypothetical protein
MTLPNELINSEGQGTNLVSERETQVEDLHPV